MRCSCVLFISSSFCVVAWLLGVGCSWWLFVVGHWLFVVLVYVVSCLLLGVSCFA